MSEHMAAMNNLVSAFKKVVQMHVPEWEIAAVEKFVELQYRFANDFQSFPVVGDKSLMNCQRRSYRELSIIMTRTDRHTLL
jgi:hypothetical protein